MELKELFTVAESVEGIYLQIGYGQGELAQEITSFDKNRKCFFYDDFTNYHYGTAYDYALDNINKHHTVVKRGKWEEITSKIDISNVAIIYFNPPIEYFQSLLETIFPLLKDNSVIYIPELYSEIANNYFDKENLFAGKRNNSYLVKVPPKIVINTTKVGRDNIVID